MKRVMVMIAAVTFATAVSVTAQPVLEHGDVVATSSRNVGESELGAFAGTLVAFGRDGAAKGLMASFSAPPLSDPLVRDGIIYVGTRYPEGIQRFTLSGQQLAPLTTAVDAVNYLGPGPNGGLFAVNGSCELYQFAPDGSLVHFRDFQSYLPACGGVELASDGCTVYWTLSGAIARWNACERTEPELVTPNRHPNVFGALRLLSDGSFLVDSKNGFPVLHLDAQGNVIRTYAIRGQGLALDTDGTSFWTNQFGWVTKVDIATGAVVSQTYQAATYGFSVVGEPRAGLHAHGGPHEIPTMSTALLAALGVLLTLVALVRLR